MLTRGLTSIEATWRMENLPHRVDLPGDFTHLRDISFEFPEVFMRRRDFVRPVLAVRAAPKLLLSQQAAAPAAPPPPALCRGCRELTLKRECGGS